MNRLFDETEEERIAATTPLKATKTNPKKFNHFEFGDGEDEETPRGRNASRKEGPRDKSKSQANWNFEDFVTPEKINPKNNPQAARSFEWENDEVSTCGAKDALGPVLSLRRVFISVGLTDIL